MGGTIDFNSPRDTLKTLGWDSRKALGMEYRLILWACVSSLARRLMDEHAQIGCEWPNTPLLNSLHLDIYSCGPCVVVQLLQL